MSADQQAIAAAADARLRDAPPAAIIRWAVERFAQRVAIASSFGGPTTMAVIDMALAIDRKIPVTYIDTDLLFPETHEAVRAAAARFGIEPQAVRTGVSLGEQARVFGEALWSRDPDLCCALRKVLPQRRLLARYDAWITGLRRDQSAERAGVRVVEWDRDSGLIKVNPLASWTEEQVWGYVRERRLPYNSLHDRGYRSIGCTHCTAPVRADEPERAGRWRGFAKTECGLHRTESRG